MRKAALLSAIALIFTGIPLLAQQLRGDYMTSFTGTGSVPNGVHMDGAAHISPVSAKGPRRVPA